MNRILHVSMYAALLFILAAAVLPMVSSAASGGGGVVSQPTSLEVVLEKKFSGDDQGFEASDFSFEVVGDNDVDETVPHDGSIFLEPGTYSVTEVVPEGFDPEDWTIQWSGPRGICVNETAPIGTIVIEEIDIEQLGFATCVADNQFKPEIEGCTDSNAINYDPAADVDDGSCVYEEEIFGCTDEDAVNFDPEATVDDDSCEYDDPENGGTGTIIVAKEVSEGSNVETAFSFSGSWGTDFELADGQSTSSVLATGTYSVSETVPASWSQMNAVCVHGDESTSTPASIELEEDETVTCTFINMEDDDDDNGGGGGDNDDPVCEIDSDDLLVDDDDVFTLTWTSSGTVDRASINAGIGDVEANGSVETSIDTDTTFVLTVQTLGDEEEVVAEASCSVSVNERGGGGGGYPRGSLDRNSGGSGGDDDNGGNGGSTPDGEVLGEQIDIIPLGGAGTGAGGGATSAAIPAFALLAIAATSLRRTLRAY